MQKIGDLLFAIESLASLHPISSRYLFGRFRKKMKLLTELEAARRSDDSLNLMNFESSHGSISGASGIVDEIFKRIGNLDHTFVDIGLARLIHSPIQLILKSPKWHGLVIDDTEYESELASNFLRVGNRRIISSHILPSNVCEVLSDSGVKNNFDFLSINLAGNDYWVLKAILDRFSPRVVMAEYNAAFGPKIKWVMPFNPQHRWDGTSYFGCSLNSLTKLAESFGYLLVGCDSHGRNAFLIKGDEAASKFFSHPHGGSKFHYVSPKYHSHWFGHPRQVEQKKADSSCDRKLRPSETTCIHFRHIGRIRNRWGIQTTSSFEVEIFNYSRQTIASFGAFPIYLSYRWRCCDSNSLSRTGPNQYTEGQRVVIAPSIHSLKSGRQSILIQAPNKPGKYLLSVTLVQEGNFWFDDIDGGTSLMFTVDVLDSGAKQETRLRLE